MINGKQENMATAITRAARQLFPAGHFATEAQHTTFKGYLISAFGLTPQQFGKVLEDNKPGDDHNVARQSITVLLRSARAQFPVSIEKEVTNTSHAAFAEVVSAEPLIAATQRRR